MQSSFNCRNIIAPFLRLIQKLTAKFTKSQKEHEVLFLSVASPYLKTPVIPANAGIQKIRMTIQTATFWIATSLTLLAMTSGVAGAAINIPFTINLSENVTVTGTPRIAVDIGGNQRFANYTSGSGTNALVFTLSPTIGDVDLDGVTISSPIDLNGGTIKDTAGNDATLTFTPPNTSGIKINYPSLGMDFTNGTSGRYTLNGTVYNDISSFLTASGGTFARNSIATYFDSTGTLQTVSANTPRFDYDPITHAAKGILIEEARTNLLPNSQSDTTWVAAGTTPPTVTNSQTLFGIPCVAVTFSPANTDVGYLGSRATRTGAGSTVAPIVTGTTYASSMFVSLSRPLTGSEGIALYFTGANGLGIIYLTAANSSSFAGTWKRLILPATTAISNGTVYPTTLLGAPVSSNVTVYISRAQLEAGTFSTSYIPTSATAVTRQVDVMRIPTAGWLNTSQGGFMAQFQENSAINLTGGGSLIMGSALDGRFIYRISGGTKYWVYDGTNILPSSVAPTLNSEVKIASKYGSNGLGISLNGGVPATSAFDGTWGDQGYAWLSNSVYNGWISKWKYYPVEPTATQLQLLTQ